MALLFVDSMDAYTALTDLQYKGWTAPGTFTAFNATAGKFGGCAIGTTNDFNTKFSRPSTFVYSAGYTLNTGFWASFSTKPSSAVGGNNGGIYGFDTSTAITANANGNLVFYPFGSTTANATTGTHNVCDGLYHFIEIQIVFATTATGSVKVYVDGNLDLSLTGLITVASGTPTGQINIGSAANGQATSVTCFYDDLIVWDSTGTAFNTFPIGPQRITLHSPNGAGSSTQFTPSANANWQCVSQVYTGTANVSDATTGKVDLYAVPTLPWSPTTVNAVVMNTYANNPGGGGNVLKAQVKSSAVAAGAPITLPIALANFQTPFYTDSNSAAWTAASVNSMQIGIGD